MKNDAVLPEDEAAILQIASEAEQPLPFVDRAVTATHDVIDRFLTDDYVVALLPMVLAFGESPTRRALARATTDAPDKAVLGDHQAMADWLDIDFDEYLHHPIANRISVVNAAADQMDADDEEFDALWDVFEAWERTYEAPHKNYRVGSVGREALLEEWVADNLHVLYEHGHDVVLSQRQHVLPSRRRPDLIARLLADHNELRVGDWLVIELKVTRAYPEALRQVHEYVAEVAEQLASGDEGVAGLLIADGIDHADQNLRNDLGIDFLSLSRIGYREALLRQPRNVRKGSPL